MTCAYCQSTRTVLLFSERTPDALATYSGYALPLYVGSWRCQDCGNVSGGHQHTAFETLPLFAGEAS